MANIQDWKKCKLGDFVTLHYGKSLTAKNRKMGNIPVFSSSGCTGLHNTPLIDTEGIIIGRKGNVGSVFKTNGPFYCIDTAYYITPDDSKYNFDYLYYLLQGLGLERLNFDSAVPGLNRNIAYDQAILLPPLQEQKSIASILSALDDKIELNLQMNKTLEEMAMALYKHWFVDFGPFQGDEFVDSELGKIPKGWEISSIKDFLLINPINGLYKKKEFQGRGSRWLKMKSVYGLDLITNQEMELIEVTNKEKEKYGCKFNDLVFGRTSLVLDGIGKCAIIKSIENTPIFESNLFRLRIDSKKMDPNILFLFFKSKIGREEVKKIARQTAAVSITSKDLVQIKIPVPKNNQDQPNLYSINNFFLKIVENLEENKMLTETRDTLSPKLISGEVRVKDVEKTLSKVL